MAVGSKKRTKNQFPLLYQAHHQEYDEDLPFWVDLAHQREGEILELGCGTGRVLIPLAETNQTVYGLDNDPQMLDVLRKSLSPTMMPKIQLVQGDFTNFQIRKRFDLIILPCNTYSTLETIERHATLKSIFAHLSTGGIFAASMPNPFGLADLETNDEPEIETTFMHPETGNPVQVSADWEQTETHVYMNWHYDHLLPDGQIERITTTIRHHLTPTDTYIDEFTNIGFSIRATYGDFDKSAFTPSSPYLILIAEKD